MREQACHLCGNPVSDGRPSEIAADIQHVGYVQRFTGCAKVHDTGRGGVPQTTVACERCGLVQTLPHPDPAEVAVYYASGQYRREFPPLAVYELDENLEPTGRMVEPTDPAYGTALDRGAMHTAKRLVRDYQIAPTDRVLEVGCGDGRVAAALVLDGLSVIAIEGDPKNAAAAEERMRSAWEEQRPWPEAVTGEESKEPHCFGPGSHSMAETFDFVYALQVVEHFADPVRELAENVTRYAKPGGVVVVEVPCVECPYVSLTHFFQKPHVVNYSADTLRAALTLAGLKDITTRIEGSVLVGAGIRRAEGEAFFDPDLSKFVPGHEIAKGLQEWERKRLAKAVPTERIERFLNGAPIEEFTEQDVNALRDDLRRYASTAAEAILSLGDLAQMMERREIDPWHADPWMRGFLSGRVYEGQKTAQVVSHLCNELMMGLNREVVAWLCWVGADPPRVDGAMCFKMGDPTEADVEAVKNHRAAGKLTLAVIGSDRVTVEHWPELRDAAHGWAVVEMGLVIEKGGVW